MQNDSKHSLNKAFSKSDAAKPTALEQEFEQLRAEAEQTISELKAAAQIAEELGYNIDDVPVSMLHKAIEDSASNNGWLHGDAYKPFDPDMAFATPESVKEYLENSLKRSGIKKTPKPDQASLDL